MFHLVLLPAWVASWLVKVKCALDCEEAVSKLLPIDFYKGTIACTCAM